MALLDLVLDVYGAVLTRQHGAAFTSPEINAIRFGSGAHPAPPPPPPLPGSTPPCLCCVCARVPSLPVHALSLTLSLPPGSVCHNNSGGGAAGDGGGGAPEGGAGAHGGTAVGQHAAHDTRGVGGDGDRCGSDDVHRPHHEHMGAVPRPVVCRVEWLGCLRPHVGRASGLVSQTRATQTAHRRGRRARRCWRRAARLCAMKAFPSPSLATVVQYR